MKIRLLILLSFSVTLVIGVGDLSAQKWDWVKKTGNNIVGNDAPRRILPDSEGNICMVGLVKGSNEFGEPGDYINLEAYGTHDIHLQKFDNDGATLWVKRFGSVNTDQATGLNIDEDQNWYVGGYYSDQCNFWDTTLSSAGSIDCFVMSLNSAGEFRWIFSFGGKKVDRLWSLSGDKYGNSYVTGLYTDTLVFGTDSIFAEGEQDIYVAKIDSSGNPAWIKSYGSVLDDVGSGIVFKDSLIYVTGSFRSEAFFDEHSITVHGSNVTAPDAFLFKTNAFGTVEWVNNDGGAANDFGNTIDVDPSGNIVSGGTFRGTGKFGNDNEVSLVSNGESDIFLSYYTPLGSLVKTLQFGGVGVEDIQSINYSEVINKFFIGGRFQDTILFQGIEFESEGPKDLMVMQFDDTLGLEWKKQVKGVPYGGKDPNIGSIYADSLENIFVTGGFLKPVYFDSILLTPHPINKDIFYGMLRPKLKAKFEVINEVCQFDSLAFINMSTYNATTFEWLFEEGQPETSTEENPMIYYSNIGQYDVTLIVNGDEQTDTLFYPDFISVNGLPDVMMGQDTSLCVGEQLQLDAGIFNSYLWNTGETGQQITVDSTGIYIVLVSNAENCNNSDSISVQFNELPVIDLGPDTTICQGDSILLNAGDGFDSYAWNTGAVENQIYVDSTGLYTVEVRDEFFCFGNDSIFISVEVCVGIQEEIIQQNIRLYPNPASLFVEIELNDLVNQIEEVSVINTSGKQVYFANTSSEKEYKIDLSGLNTGIYIIRIQLKNGDVYNKKLIITD